jgi:uncharacterized protein
MASAALVLALATTLRAQTAALPLLTGTVNDFAHIIGPADTAEIDRMSRALQAATGDVAVVATVPNINGYGDLREYAVKLFENQGRGIGDKGKNNGALIVLALQERQVRVEVGYGLEPWITDGFAGETSRLVMAPAFRAGDYGGGLKAGAARIIGRIAQGRNVTLRDVAVPSAPAQPSDSPISFSTIVMLIFFAILILSRIGGGPRGGLRTWGGSGWSGYSSGVGSFGGGGGGGFGGGFGGFGGGSSGGGGGGSSW